MFIPFPVLFSGFIAMLERRGDPLLPFRSFLWRLLRFMALALLILGVSLGIGVLGYHQIEGMSWVDSFLNAAMILGGMGPVNTLHTEAGKVFAGVYALFSGIVFLVAVGVLLAPVIHRVFHQFHLEADTDA